jgi:hypothetical protein
MNGSGMALGFSFPCRSFPCQSRVQPLRQNQSQVFDRGRRAILSDDSGLGVGGAGFRVETAPWAAKQIETWRKSFGY